ncbi:MAG: bile acid:sodium symporter, partial [Pseudoruegeria sp.]
VMLVSFCPGGVTSSILTKLAGGTVALSITLTAVVSLLSVMTVPLMMVWAGTQFLGDNVPSIDATGIAISMFAITAAPVLLGLLTRAFASSFAQQIERSLSITASALFIVIILGAIVENRVVLAENLLTLGPLVITMIVTLLVIGVLLAWVLGLSGPDGVCISIEMGVQNAALGIAVAGLAARADGIPEIGVPAAAYGVLMYGVTLPALVVLKRLAKA